MEIDVSNIIKFCVIFSLSEGEKYGYELMNKIEERTGKRPSASQIYPFLQKLEESDLIEVNSRGDRGKKVYSLTSEGEEYVESKLEMFSDIISGTIEKDLTTCAHCGCKVYEGAHVEKIDGEKVAFCCEHCAKSYRKHIS